MNKPRPATVRQQLHKGLASIPFPDLPVPKTTKKRERPSNVAPVAVSEPKSEQPETKTIQERLPLGGGIFIPEATIDGELEPEPPKREDKGDHIIEELDLEDYG